MRFDFATSRIETRGARRLRRWSRLDDSDEEVLMTMADGNEG